MHLGIVCAQSLSSRTTGHSAVQFCRREGESRCTLRDDFPSLLFLNVTAPHKRTRGPRQEPAAGLRQQGPPNFLSSVASLDGTLAEWCGTVVGVSSSFPLTCAGPQQRQSARSRGAGSLFREASRAQHGCAAASLLPTPARVRATMCETEASQVSAEVLKLPVARVSHRAFSYRRVTPSEHRRRCESVTVQSV